MPSARWHEWSVPPYTAPPSSAACPSPTPPAPPGFIGALQVGGAVTGNHNFLDFTSKNCGTNCFIFVVLPLKPFASFASLPRINPAAAACLYLRMGGPGLRSLGICLHSSSRAPLSIPHKQTGSFYRNSGVMLQTLIPSAGFIAGFCIKGEQELISCSKGNSDTMRHVHSPSSNNHGCVFLNLLQPNPVFFCASEFGEFIQSAKAGVGA